jgi:hypothetical protein
MRQAQHIQTYVSIGESRATLNGGLRRGFSTACQTTGRFTFPFSPDKSLMTQGFAPLIAA